MMRPWPTRGWYAMKEKMKEMNWEETAFSLLLVRCRFTSMKKNQVCIMQEE
jgi:hypothetical protein